MEQGQEYIDWLKQLGKENDIFYFKQFQVKDDRSTMRVGTDAVLLGIAAEISGTKSILEIGAGCGVITLILAQRSGALIDAIEIDGESAMQASENIQASPWADRIRVLHTSAQDFLRHNTVLYDLVVTNPPYFSRSFKSTQEKRNLSRHDDRLTFEELLEASNKLLVPDGKLWLILPVKESRSFRHKATASGFHLHRNLWIIPKEGKDPNRVIMAFGRDKAPHITDARITLRDRDNEFSEAYKSFAHDFYIDF